MQVGSKAARTALGKTGTELGSYTEIVDFLRAHSANPGADFEELYRRVIFTILFSNKDDHLKNHGFVYAGSGRGRLCATSEYQVPGRETMKPPFVHEQTERALAL